MGELQDINGVGNSVEKQLKDIGITTINELANTNLQYLKDNDIRNAKKIFDRAEKQGVQIKTGETVEEEQEQTRFITTGIDDLDTILGGGLQGGFLIGVSGEHKAGKTQLALQCLASAADHTDDPAVYVETEPNRFQIDRIKSLCKNKDSYKNIHKIEAYSPGGEVENLDLQRNSYDAISESFDNLSVVVVDSFVANFRLSGKFQSRADLPERNTIVADHLDGLQALSNEFDCPILMTLQTMGNPDMFSGGNLSVWGPVLMEHAITYLLNMKHGKGELREAQLKGHPAMPDDSVSLEMPENQPIRSSE